MAIVYFGPDSSDLGERDGDCSAIADIVVRLDQIILHGHTNGYRFTQLGHRDQHMAISRQQAERVRDTLVSVIASGEIQLEWFGDLRGLSRVNDDLAGEPPGGNLRRGARASGHRWAKPGPELAHPSGSAPASVTFSPARQRGIEPVFQAEVQTQRRPSSS